MNPVTRFLVAVAIAWAVLSVPLAGFSVAGEALDRIRATGILRAPFPDIWPPAVIQQPNGEIDGYDVEVLREIGRRIGAKVEYVKNSDGSVITWKEQTSGQWQGKYDIVVGGMSPTAERAEHLSFPAIYRYGMGVLAVNQSNSQIKTPADASGKRIGVLKASVHEKYLEREDFGILGMPPITYPIGDPVIVEFDHEEGAYDAVSDGKIDGTINTLPVILELIKQGRPIKIVGQPLYRAPSCIAIVPGDEEFGTLVKKTIDEMRSDGTLMELSLKWYQYDMITP
ncbi:MAG: transporter substrate-binding domain-containing protein [Mesorhizobium sp.]|uniref:transporter substrate-binding domain-containing protein n=1 Tax=unclassified Mesorhizobium TaxID=325217 RepID=UPI001209A247|nr:transporter substrate-binding domain-containing protein [Mesorhizobium sp. M2A.F.Ca.ET.029.05.1.1]TIX34020.1 MAG: transporter substrate-binding domain-containing protein [Mesorhizobium sp.]